MIPNCLNIKSIINRNEQSEAFNGGLASHSDDGPDTEALHALEAAPPAKASRTDSDHEVAQLARDKHECESEFLIVVVEAIEKSHLWQCLLLGGNG